MSDWSKAYYALRDRIQQHPRFMRLVRGYGGHPRAEVPSRRAGRLATIICQEMGLDPNVYRGNVFGAAADYIAATAA